MENIFITYLIIINLISFLLIFIDKRKAINHKWRIKESTLFSVSILGGSIGTLVSMYIFRHKTKHKTFTLGIPAILIIQIVIFYSFSHIYL